MPANCNLSLKGINIILLHKIIIIKVKLRRSPWLNILQVIMLCFASFRHLCRAYIIIVLCVEPDPSGRDCTVKTTRDTQGYFDNLLCNSHASLILFKYIASCRYSKKFQYCTLFFLPFENSKIGVVHGRISSQRESRKSRVV